MAPQTTIYKGRLISLRRERRCLPNGHSADLEIVEHPGAVLIVPFVGPDRIILLRQYRPVFKTYLYELPAGTLAPGERPGACALRELREETGMAAGKIVFCGEIFPVPGYSTEKIRIYRASDLRPGLKQGDPDEIIERLEVTRREVRLMWTRGRFRDAKTICALALVGWL